MIKEWILVVLLSISPNNPDEPSLFIFDKPQFDTIEKCMEWTNNNQVEWLTKVYEAYGPMAKISTVVCIRDKKLKEIVPEWGEERDWEEIDKELPVKGTYIEASYVG